MKPKVAFYWCASCGGCEEAILDLGLDLLPVLDAVDIVFWPVALDFKEKDVEAMADGAIDICFVNGAVRTSEQARMAQLMRRKSRLVVAFGACAQMGGIPGLANLTSAPALLAEVYGAESPPSLTWADRGRQLDLPELFDTVYALQWAIPVDYAVPGCPPSPKVVAAAVAVLLGGELPPPGTVLAPDRAACEECPRRDSHHVDMQLDRFRRVTEIEIDPNICMLTQGLPCLGPATRAGCGARCISGNMPCTGCFGPISLVRDFGAKALCSIASILSANGEADIDRSLESIPDPVGLFYRYSLPGSFLQRRRI